MATWGAPNPQNAWWFELMSLVLYIRKHVLDQDYPCILVMNPNLILILDCYLGMIVITCYHIVITHQNGDNLVATPSFLASSSRYCSSGAVRSTVVR